MKGSGSVDWEEGDDSAKLHVQVERNRTERSELYGHGRYMASLVIIRSLYIDVMERRFCTLLLTSSIIVDVPDSGTP